MALRLTLHAADRQRTMGRMDLQALRERTRPEHEATEAQLPLMDAGLSRTTYVRALQALYPVLRGWEHWAAAHCPAGLCALLEGRQRSALIERDLCALGAWPAPEASEAADISSVRFESLLSEVAPGDEEGREACFCGALYVMEGSTLGGQFIARRVEETLGLAQGEGNAYFQGYGAETGARWREVREALAALPDKQLEGTVRAASRTFALFAEALAAAGFRQGSNSQGEGSNARAGAAAKSSH